MGDWTFFSNYGHVLVCLARDREARLRDVAAEVGITERAVQKIVRDMQDAGVITVSKQGRCNRYRINRRKSLRHSLESHCSVGKLLNLVARAAPEPAPAEDMADRDADTPDASAAEPVPTTPAAKPAGNEAKPEKPKRAGVDVRQQGSLF